MPAITSRKATTRRRTARGPIVLVTSNRGPLNDFWYDDPATGARVPRVTQMRPDTAMMVSTVAACVRLLAETVASLPCKAYSEIPGGKRPIPEHWAYSLFHDRPNDEMTSFEYVEAEMASLLLRGNFYALKVGQPGENYQLWPIHPDHVTVKRVARNERIYRVKMPGANDQYFNSREIHHVMGHSLDGVIGVSPIALHAHTFNMAASLEEHGARTFDNGAAIRGVLEHPTRFGGRDRQASFDEFRRNWQAAYAGPSNAGKTAILEDGMTYKPISMNQSDAEYLETRKFQRTEICSIFRVPPHMVGDLERATFSNIEHQSIEFVTYTLRPWLVRIERAVKRDIFELEPGIFIEFLVDALLRGDTKSRADANAVRFRNGTLSIDEWRAMENMNPIGGEVGGQYFVSRDLATVEQVVAGLTTAGATESGKQAIPDDANGEDDDGQVAIAPMLRDAADRIASMEQRAVSQGKISAKPGDEKRAQWGWKKYRPYVKRVMAPFAETSHMNDQDEMLAVNTVVVSMLSANLKDEDARRAAVLAILEDCYGN